MWSADNPKLCAIMEKNRLFVLNDYQQEEPLLTSGYLCDFSNLQVKNIRGPVASEMLIFFVTLQTIFCQYVLIFNIENLLMVLW